MRKNVSGTATASAGPVPTAGNGCSPEGCGALARLYSVVTNSGLSSRLPSVTSLVAPPGSARTSAFARRPLNCLIDGTMMSTSSRLGARQLAETGLAAIDQSPVPRPSR